MSDLPQISKAEFEVIKIIWKHVPMGILKEYMKKGFALDDDRLKRLGVAIILMNCLPVSETSAPLKRYSGERFWKSMLPVSIMIPMPRVPSYSSSRFRIRCTGQLTSTQSQKLFTSVPTLKKIIWDLPHGLVTPSVAQMWKLPKTILPSRNLML